MSKPKKPKAAAPADVSDLAPGPRSFTSATDEPRGLIYVADPTTGKIKAVPREDARQLVFAGGWKPVDEHTGEELRTDEWLKEQSGPVEAFAYGAAKGVTGGLVDLAVPTGSDEARALRGIQEGSPIASGLGEVAGTVAPFVGPLKAARLATIPGLADEAGQLLTRAVAGETPGFLEQVGARAMGLGLEGGAYGVTNELAQSHVDDTPLTAEKMAFGFMAGALPGAILGVPLGVAEGAINGLGRRFAHRGAFTREEVIAPGTSDLDARLIGERDHGMSSPGMLEEFQAAHAKDPLLTPDLYALAKDKGPVGEQARRELFQEGPMLLADAEGKTAKAFDDLADMEAAGLGEWSGRIKREHAERLIPEGLVSDADVEEAVLRASKSGEPGLITESPRAPDIDNVVKSVMDTVHLDDGATGALKASLGAADDDALRSLITRGLITNDNDIAAQISKYLKRVPSGLRKAGPANVNALTHEEGLAGLSHELGANDNAVRVANDDGTMGLGHVETGPRQDFATIDAAKFDGMRGESLEAAKSELAANPGAAESWASGKHPPTIEVDGDTGAPTHRNVTDGRHRIRAAQEAGLESMPVRVRRLDADGNVTESTERIALGKARQPRVAGAANDNRAEWAWRREALRQLDTFGEELERVDATPRGYTGTKNKELRDMRGLLSGVRDKVASGKRWQAATELDYLKKRLGKIASKKEFLGAGDDFMAMSRRWYEDVRQNLQNPRYWGSDFSTLQEQMNGLLHKRLSRSGRFWDTYFSDAGVPDPRNPWANLKRADRAKLHSAVSKFNTPEHDLEFQMANEHIREARELNDLMGKYFKTDRLESQQLKAWGAAVDSAETNLKRAKHFATRIEQGKALLGGGGAAVGGVPVRAAAGYLLGGPAGLAAGLVAGHLMNPGKALYARSVLERVLRTSEGRIARGVTTLLTGKKFKMPAGPFTGLAATGLTSLLSERHPERRAKAYQQTLEELADGVAPGRTEMAMDGLRPAHLFVPKAGAGAAEAYRHAIQVVLQRAPALPTLGPFGDSEPAYISDAELQDWEDVYRGALDPIGVLEAAHDGELSQEMVDAADESAPALMAHIRSVIIDTVTSSDVEVSYETKVQLSTLFKMPLDPTMTPEYIGAMQLLHRSRFQDGMGPKSRRSFGETGVNQGYEKGTMSNADRLEREDTIR